MGVNYELSTLLRSSLLPERNSLADNTIEALECLKAWFDKGFIEREENVH
jgi:hypothetical protein